MAGNWKKTLKTLHKSHDEAREKAEQGGSGGGGFERGKHAAWIVSAKRTQRQSDNANQIEWKLVGANGDEEGNVHTFWSTLESADDLVWFEKILLVLEVDFDADDFADEESLDALLERIMDGQFLVRCAVVASKADDQYSNTYINKLLDPDNVDDAEEPDWDEFREGGKKKTKKTASKKSSKDDDDDDAEDEPARGKKGGKKPAKDEDEDEEVELTYEIVNKMKQAELVEIIENNELKVNKKSPLPQLRKSICKVLELEPADDDEDDDDEPKGKAGKASSKGGKKSSKDDDDDDEEEEIEVGDLVFGLHDGETIQGKVTKIDGKLCTVKPSKGKAYVGVKLAKLEKSDTPF